MNNNSTNYLILGAGLTGMSAASILKEEAIVLEKTERPGGLVKSINLDGYWFDHVIHLLHFRDPRTESIIKKLLGDTLAPLYPEAWVETTEGTGRYPLQMNLYGLSQEAITSTIKDLAATSFNIEHETPTSFEDMLLKTFGKYFCELFMFPYNRKVWKRPLNELAPSGFQWNIDNPDFELVVKGAITDNAKFETYNANGWYPRPDKNAKLRGMEVLSDVLSKQVEDLRLNSNVKRINLKNKEVTVDNNGQEITYSFTKGCLSTIPLPILLAKCEDLDPRFKNLTSTLKYNRVVSAMICIEGPHPKNRGHWRYYGQEDICFTRLVYMRNFDKHTSPENGWGLLVEMLEPSEWDLKDDNQYLSQIQNDIIKVNALPEDCKIINSAVEIIDPAYVVFTNESKKWVAELEEYFLSHGIKLLGRYGRWEYSSMAQVMNDGFTWAEEQIK